MYWPLAIYDLSFFNNQRTEKNDIAMCYIKCDGYLKIKYSLVQVKKIGQEGGGEADNDKIVLKDLINNWVR